MLDHFHDHDAFWISRCADCDGEPATVKIGNERVCEDCWSIRQHEADAAAERKERRSA